jgi:hypothetical protein
VILSAILYVVLTARMASTHAKYPQLQAQGESGMFTYGFSGLVRM